MINLIDSFGVENFMIIMMIFIILLIVLNIVLIIKFKKLNNRYTSFMQKLNKGSNIEEALKEYIAKVDEVSEENKEIEEYCRKIDNNIAKCIKKVGMVRYNAFKDTGSDLSFTLALLNDENTGVVLNGIYSREMSNIYAKPINKGISKYALSEQEKEAIDIAIAKR